METQFNKHLRDFRESMTLEYNVKSYTCPKISDDDYEFEIETGTFTNQYAKKCFEDIKKLKYNWILDFSFAGRSNGWFCLLCDEKKPTDKQLSKIETIVEKYLKNYSKELETFYN